MHWILQEQMVSRTFQLLYQDKFSNHFQDLKLFFGGGGGDWLLTFKYTRIQMPGILRIQVTLWFEMFKTPVL